MTPDVPDPTVEARADRLADWLGEMPESRNVFDITDEATTVISIDVEALVASVRRRVAVDLRDLLDDPALAGRATGGQG